MLVEKTASRIAETAIPVDPIAPLSPVVRLRASEAGFRPVCSSDLNPLTEFYADLDEPLSDLNAITMIAWRLVLDLHLLIEDGVLYVIGNWEGGPMLWGPPIGAGVTVAHVRKAFHLLRELDPENSEPIIAYLWEEYSLWNQLAKSDEFLLIREGTEYVYDINLIASLPGRAYKKKRKDYFQFQQAHHPMVVEYSDDLVPGCLELLDKWMEQKSNSVAGEELEKLLIEYKACQSALNEHLPLIGVVALIGDKVCAFSLGSAHRRDRLYCLFEKTDLDFPQAPSFIFSELARKYQRSYSEITLGEDWHINYLTTSKRLWKPAREQKSYYLEESLTPLVI